MVTAALGSKNNFRLETAVINGAPTVPVNNVFYVDFSTKFKQRVFFDTILLFVLVLKFSRN